MSILVEGQVYLAAKDIETNKGTFPQGTRFVYDEVGHNVLYDDFYRQFHVEDEPENKLALRDSEIAEKLEGMEEFVPHNFHPEM